MFGRISVFVALVAARAAWAAPSFVDASGTGVSTDTPAGPPPLKIDAQPFDASRAPGDLPVSGVFDPAFAPDAEPAWAMQAGEWSGQNAPPLGLSRMGSPELMPSGPASPMAEPPAAVPLPGALVGGGVTLAALAAFYVLRRRQLR